MNFTYNKGWGEQYFTYFFYFCAGETLSQVQSTNNWYNLTYNLILNESTLSLTCFNIKFNGQIKKMRLDFRLKSKINVRIT